MSGGGETQTVEQSVPQFVEQAGRQTFRAGRQIAQSPTGESGFLGQSENFVSPFALIPGAEQVAPLSPFQQFAGGAGLSRFANGTPFENAAQGAVTDIAQAGPFSDLTNQLVSQAQGNVVDQFNTQVAPQIASQAFSTGVGNTGLAAQESQQRFGLARALGQTETDIRNQAFNRQLQASSLAPALGELDRARLQDVLGFGGLQQANTQAQLSADVQQFLEQRNEALRRLQILQGSNPSGNFGGSTTTSSNSSAGFGSIAGAGLGAAGLGLQAASLFGSGGAAAGPLALFNAGLAGPFGPFG